MNKKFTVGIFKFTGCAGCQMSVLRLEEELQDIFKAVDISYFKMGKRNNRWSNYDLSLIEGSISTPRELEDIKYIRANSKIIVALGDCATHGCVPSIKNWMREREAEKKVYKDLTVIHSFKIHGIGEYVPVDVYLRGCPPEKENILELFKSVLLGIMPYLRPYSVCVECKLKDNLCLAVSKRLPCMGSVTHAGCGAACPSVSYPCIGCYGPIPSANAPALARAFEEYGLSKDDIVRRFRKFTGTAPEFKEVVE